VAKTAWFLCLCLPSYNTHPLPSTLEFLAFLSPPWSRVSPLLPVFPEQQSRTRWDCAGFWALTCLDWLVTYGWRPACCGEIWLAFLLSVSTV